MTAFQKIKELYPSSFIIPNQELRQPNVRGEALSSRLQQGRFFPSPGNFQTRSDVCRSAAREQKAVETVIEVAAMSWWSEHT